MKVTNIRNAAPNITPQEIACAEARFSRSLDPIEDILGRTVGKDTSKLLANIDYGHASIGGLTGTLEVAIEGVSMYMAMRLFEFAQMADGQESSTRYIKMSPESVLTRGFLPDDVFNTPSEEKAYYDRFEELVATGFQLYNELVGVMDSAVKANPEGFVTRSPDMNDRMWNRLVQNYALDRCRYFIPFAAKTNVALNATARIWADVIRSVDSLGFPEAQELASKLRKEVLGTVPDFVRHSYATDNSILAVCEAHRQDRKWSLDDIMEEADVEVSVTVGSLPEHYTASVSTDHTVMDSRTNRYDRCSKVIAMTPATFVVRNIAIAELRDLMRHRTGCRDVDLRQNGFYLPEAAVKFIRGDDRLNGMFEKFKTLARENYEATKGYADRKGFSAPPFLPYAMFLGSQVDFAHTQQLDKLLYEIELRTGKGAHFRYAQHMRQVAACLERYQFPGFYPWSMVRTGTEEPEVF